MYSGVVCFLFAGHSFSFSDEFHPSDNDDGFSVYVSAMYWYCIKKYEKLLKCQHEFPTTSAACTCSADGEEEESGKEGGHVHVTESRRRTRTRSDDSSRNDGSADEESVDHVSALLMSRRSRQRQQLRIEPLHQLHGDPPIVECDTSFDDDKQQNNRLTREEFDDDCWGAD
jgi:hypothetical protein